MVCVPQFWGVTGFQAHIGDAEAVFPQVRQLFRGFHLDAFGVGIDTHAGYPGQLFLDGLKNFQQPFLLQRQIYDYQKAMLEHLQPYFGY